MPIKMDTNAREGNTYAINIRFYDENSLAFAPNSLYWTLHDGNNTVINSRENIGITSLQTSIDLVLTSADTLFQSDREHINTEKRFVTITGNYNSDLGNNLTLTEQIRFDIDRLIKVS